MNNRARQDLYRRLLAGARLRQSTAARETLGLEHVSDKSRILHSAPFRRLESKAQVFSRTTTGIVRTRLTHSIEVSNYGELIAEQIAERLIQRGSLPAELRLPFVQIVENACLIHDIGNPPFGHMGEYAIQRWFQDNREDLIAHWTRLGEITRNEAERYVGALSSFDGNPQGLRIITRLQWFNDEYGMNLTCALLAAYLKYLGQAPTPRLPFCRKSGFFPTEQPIVQQVWSALGLKADQDGMPLQRHPLAFIMEAADDIAFCLSDIEDAIERNVITEDSVLESLRSPLHPYVDKAESEARAFGSALSANGTYHMLRLTLSRYFVRCAVTAYEANEDAILQAGFTQSLLDHERDARTKLDALKSFAAERVYTSRALVETELGGLRAVWSLLDRFKEVLMLTPTTFRDLLRNGQLMGVREHPIEALLCSLLPQKQLAAYAWEADRVPRLEPVYRTHLIVDYVSGMTDAYALRVINMINGSQPPVSGVT